MVRNASSTLEAFLALVSKNGMPKESANSLAAAVSTTLSSRSLLLPDHVTTHINMETNMYNEMISIKQKKINETQGVGRRDRDTFVQTHISYYWV